jgi:hypothetical protein
LDASSRSEHRFLLGGSGPARLGSGPRTGFPRCLDPRLVGVPRNRASAQRCRRRGLIS